MKNVFILLMGVFSCAFVMAQDDEFIENEESVSEEILYQLAVDSIESSFTYQTGVVDIKDGLATINVPEGYKFLDGDQSNTVLTDLWGNPPSEVLGLLFPEETTPLSDNFSYAVEVTYSEEGFIEDEDAEDIDYDELLEGMKEDVKEVNPQRIEQGFPAVELVGWASEPFYDKGTKKLHWAKELKFGDSEVNTLNYNIRILGRKGYLNMNAIGNMDALPRVKEDIRGILESVEFNQGFKYSDFNPDLDDVAAYGIGGLIAGKILAKAGFFALLLKFWKVIAIGAVAAFGFIKKFLFGETVDKKE